MHSRILTHLSMHGGGAMSPPKMMGGRRLSGGENRRVDGMDHDMTDVLAAEPKRKGGLMRSGGDVS